MALRIFLCHDMLFQVLGLGAGVIGQVLLLQEEPEIISTSIQTGKPDKNLKAIKQMRKWGVQFTLLGFVLQFVGLFF